jgi:hypothetical protein
LDNPQGCDAQRLSTTKTLPKSNLFCRFVGKFSISSPDVALSDAFFGSASDKWEVCDVEDSLRHAGEARKESWPNKAKNPATVGPAGR